MIRKMKIKLLEIHTSKFNFNITLCTLFKLMKLSVDINVVKEFLESSFYHCVENHCGTLCHALMGQPIQPLPPVAVN